MVTQKDRAIEMSVLFREAQAKILALGHHFRFWFCVGRVELDGPGEQPLQDVYLCLGRNKAAADGKPEVRDGEVWRVRVLIGETAYDLDSCPREVRMLVAEELPAFTDALVEKAAEIEEETMGTIASVRAFLSGG